MERPHLKGKKGAAMIEATAAAHGLQRYRRAECADIA
jgi:hypothetical protein